MKLNTTIARSLTVLAAFVAIASSASAEVITAKRTGGRFDDGMAVSVQVQDRGIVRGDGSIDTATGVVSFVLDLETDRMLDGPNGKLTVTLRDASGTAIETVTSPEIGIGGKRWGHRRRDDFRGNVVIPMSVASRVKSVDVSVQYLGNGGGILDQITPGNIIKAAGIVISAL